MKHITLQIQLELQGSDGSHTTQSCMVNLCNEDIGKLMNVSGKVHVTIQDTHSKEVMYLIYKYSNPDPKPENKEIDGIKERIKNFTLQ